LFIIASPRHLPADARRQPAEDWYGKKASGNNKRFVGMDRSAAREDLVDRVHQEAESDDLCDRVQTLAQPFHALSGAPKNGPEERGTNT
jgi:hypothetical protein